MTEKKSSSVSRRQFMKLSTGAMAVGVAAASGWGLTEWIASDEPADSWHKSVCRYCGNGCGVMIGMKDGKVTRIRGDVEAHNKGVICIKGIKLAELTQLKGRAKMPKIKKNGVFVEASWDEAMSLVASKFRQSIQEQGPQSVAFYGSGQLLTEESYTANKLFKAGIGSNNVDGNPRLCMASAAVGYVQSFGKDEPAGAYDDIDHANCFFLIGSNAYECHPPLWERIMIRKKSDPSVKVIVVDPRYTETAKRADIHLPVIPGTDQLLLNSMCQVIMEDKLADLDFIAKHVNFNDGKKMVSIEDFQTFLKDYTPEKVAATLGVSAAQIRKVAHLFATSPATMSLWTMGINQRTQGVFLNNTLNSLHLITGHICKKGATPLSLTGQSNACGGVRDTGSLAHLLPHGRLIKKEKHRREMEKLWGVPKGRINAKPGHHAVNLFRAMESGDVSTALIMCTNPAQSLPNAERYRKAMEKCFLVVADVFEDTETAKLADVILPAALYIEKMGIYGQTERRYQIIEKLIDPPGEAKSDLDILTDLAVRLGYGDLIKNRTPEDVWNEYRKLSSHSVYNFEGMSYDRLKKARGMQWPCPDENHPGTVRRYTTGDPYVPQGEDVKFYGKPDGKAVVFLRPYIPTAEQLSKRFPFHLTTGRVTEQWHTGTMTDKIPSINRASGRGHFEISPEDATRLGIRSGDEMEVASAYGTIKAPVKVSDVQTSGVIFAAFYDSKFLVNRIVADNFDPVSKEPEFKVTAVSAKRVVTTPDKD
jgi:nitrate reductase NapA